LRCFEQVTYISGLNQGGLLSRKSVVVFKAVGPATNKVSVLANCEKNTKGRWLGLKRSIAKKMVKKATDTWWPSKCHCRVYVFTLCA
jgi:hypothetical protein